MTGLALGAFIGLVGMFDYFEGRGPTRPRSQAKQSHFRDVPDFLDIVSLAITCGASVLDALSLGARLGPASIRSRLHLLVAAISKRVSFSTALASAEVDAGDPIAVILDVLEQGHIEGGSVARRLEYLAVDYRRIGASRDSAEARRLSVRILFPMVLCMLPSFALLTIVPVLVASPNVT